MDSNADMLRMLIAKKYALQTHLHNNKIIYITFGYYGTMSVNINDNWVDVDKKIKKSFMRCFNRYTGSE